MTAVRPAVEAVVDDPFRARPDVRAVPGGGEPRWVDGATVAGDPDLLMHYAVTRAHGRAVHGPPASAMFGEVPRGLVLDYLHTELDWGLEHGTESYAVLNALRAMACAQEGVLLSKVQAGLRALETVDLPSAVIQRALRARQGDTEPSPPGTEAAGLIRRARAVLAAARVDAGDAQ